MYLTLKKEDTKPLFSIPHNICFKPDFLMVICKGDRDSDIICVIYARYATHGDKGATETDIFKFSMIGVGVYAKFNIGLIIYAFIGSLIIGWFHILLQN